MIQFAIYLVALFQQDAVKVWVSPSLHTEIGFTREALLNAISFSVKLWTSKETEYSEFRNDADIRIESASFDLNDQRVAFYRIDSKTVRLNSNFHFYINRPAKGKFSLILVLLHEFGHSFGIDHDERSAIMKSRIIAYPFNHWDINKTPQENGFTSYELRLFSRF